MNTKEKPIDGTKNANPAQLEDDLMAVQRRATVEKELSRMYKTYQQKEAADIARLKLKIIARGQKVNGLTLLQEFLASSQK